MALGLRQDRRMRRFPFSTLLVAICLLPVGIGSGTSTHGHAIAALEGALAYSERLFPDSIGEACFIDHGGPENARVVRGVRARPADLSPDESGNPSFRPTFALPQGQVYQARPYVSPDTG